MSFDVARLNTAPFNGTCGPSGSFLPAQVEVDVEAFGDEELTLLEVIARNESAGLERRIASVLDSADLSRWVIFDASVLGDAFPLEGWCVDVQVVDPAGNVAPIATSCEACRIAQAVGDEGPDQLQFEAVPGGPCDEASDSSSSSGTEVSSTSSSTESGAEAGEYGEPGPSSSDDAPASDGTSPDRGCACTTRHGSTPWWLAMLVLAWRRRAQPRSAFQ